MLLPSNVHPMPTVTLLCVILACICFMIDVFPHPLPAKFTALGLLLLTLAFISAGVL